ncbi:MAG: Ig-like domain-containing protein [Gemmatimonadales bacterium]
MDALRSRSWLVVLYGATTISTLSCFGDSPTIGPGEIVAVRVFPDTILLAVGEDSSFSAVALDASVAAVAGGPPSWSSEPMQVATISNTGVVQAVGLGTATVTAVIEGASGSATVVVAPPAIALTPGSVVIGAVAGGADPPSQTVAVTNTGPGILNGLTVDPIAYGGPVQGWLQAALASDSAPTDLVLQASTGTLLPGSYTATVSVRSAVAGNSPQSVDVTFTVTAPPAGNPGQLVVVTQPAGATANVAFSTQPVVEIRDSAGTRVFAATDPVTASVFSGNGVVLGTTTVVPVNGQATFTDLVIRGPQTAGDSLGTGNHQLQFSATGLTSATSAAFDVRVSFSYNVQYLFRDLTFGATCLQCHSTFNTTAGLVGQPPSLNSGSCGTLVVASNANGSFLMQKLDGTQPAGCGVVMPLTGTLSTLLRDIVRNWINQGANNN